MRVGFGICQGRRLCRLRDDNGWRCLWAPGWARAHGQRGAKPLSNREKALEISIATLESGLFQARKETLRCKGLLTSRGVLESALVNLHAARKLGKKFNAKDTCHSLDKTPPTEGTEAWKLKECYEVMRALHPDSLLATESIGKAYSKLYSTLSEEIHGYPWSGESVSVASV